MNWFPRLLFLLTILLAAALAGTVFLAPWLDPRKFADPWPRLLDLFANDSLVRRTALASAAGLLVTAFVFFRPPLFRSGKKFPPNKLPPPGNFAGA